MLAHITTLFALSTLAQAEELEPMPAPPTYVKTGGAVTVPNSHNRSILSSSVGAGVWVNDHNTLGLRVTYVYEPTNPISDVEITHAWGGTLGITLSRMPFVSEIAPGVRVASGYSGQGVMLAPYVGKLLAEGDAQVSDLMARVPTPPFPGGRWLRWPLTVAGLSWYALRDRL